ncbi:MAG TPA: alternative ribosome rescue aminoacyl-tRNA hydrolase ArfB, partial [Candidatus Deferrimicrobiaceae bacterium]|nr:alternative ribosome rescue aminoacyl-tRNA hydrolase ArfB [Candidatus Deferrimicrobiaceae bacterium]
PAGRAGLLSFERAKRYDGIMIRLNETIFLDENEISERFHRSSGPGGQNVNKTATAVQLRFDVRNSRSLPEDVRERLVRLAGKRMTGEGVLVIEARRFRTQERNRGDARSRLIALIRKAAEPVALRRKTRPPRESERRRLETKRRRGRIKGIRRSKPSVET